MQRVLTSHDEMNGNRLYCFAVILGGTPDDIIFHPIKSSLLRQCAY